MSRYKELAAMIHSYLSICLRARAFNPYKFLAAMQSMAAKNLYILISDLLGTF